MTDWFKKMTTLIDAEDENTPAPLITTLAHTAFFKPADKPATPFFTSSNIKRDLNFSDRQNSSNPHSKGILKKDPAIQAQVIPQAKDKPMIVDEEDKDDNLKTLKRLRELPRGTQVDSRVAAIESLLGEKEVFKSLKLLRWPQGVMCPRCHSSNVVRREPPANATDKRHYYICLNCKGEGGISDFDDFTGLPIGSMHALRQWIFCWYLLGFCSVTQIAKVLGLSAQEVMQMARYGAELTQLPEGSLLAKSKEELRNKEKKAKEEATKGLVLKDEELSRSESVSPLKPGYKSKK